MSSLGSTSLSVPSLTHGRSGSRDEALNTLLAAQDLTSEFVGRVCWEGLVFVGQVQRDRLADESLSQVRDLGELPAVICHGRSGQPVQTLTWLRSWILPSQGMLRNHRADLDAAPLWRQTWKGPVLSEVASVASSGDGKLLAFGFSQEALVELWDVSSYPCPMTLLELPASSFAARHFECHLMQWSHQNSSITCIYRLKSSSRRAMPQSSLAEMSLLIQWDLVHLHIAHCQWSDHRIS